MLKLQYYPESEILLKPAEPVTCFDKELESLSVEMIAAMYHYAGVGLAAPQIGVSKRMFVFQILHQGCARSRPLVVVNPRITWGSITTSTAAEGCLSILGMMANVTRPRQINVEFRDVYGNPWSLLLRDMEARIFQHEYDHLDGWLYPFYSIPGAVKGQYKPRTYTWLDDARLEALQLITD